VTEKRDEEEKEKGLSVFGLEKKAKERSQRKM